MARFTYISERRSDLAILRESYFHETLHVRSFLKIKPSMKFLNLQYHIVWVQRSGSLVEYRIEGSLVRDSQEAL